MVEMVPPVLSRLQMRKFVLAASVAAFAALRPNLALASDVDGTTSGVFQNPQPLGATPYRRNKCFTYGQGFQGPAPYLI